MNALHLVQWQCCVSTGEPDVKRKQVVREKTAQYLLQAEKIYNQYLASKSAELSLWDVRM
jgi:hypothetical protein